MTAPVDVLAIGAHPDDAELGCGGTLILASDDGLRVAVADLTRGEAATAGTAEERDAERQRAAELLGLAARPCLELPDTEVGRPAHRAALIDLIRALRPRIVLAPYPEDRHPDHAAAGRLAREASFLAGLARVGGGGVPHRPAHVFHYLLHYPVAPSFVVDVSKVWSRKLAAVRAHASQFGAAANAAPASPLTRFLEVMDAASTVHGAAIGAERGEAFHYPGPVPLTGLPGLAAEATHDGYRSYH